MIKVKRGRYLLLASMQAYIAYLKEKNKEYLNQSKKSLFTFSKADLKYVSKEDFKKVFRPMTYEDWEKLKMTDDDWGQFKAFCKEAEESLMKDNKDLEN